MNSTPFRNRAGVTILEALLVAFILSTVLGATAYALRGYARATVHSSKKDRVMAGASGALEVIRADIAAAYTLSTNNTNPRLLLERVDPALAARVGAVSSAQPWDPFDSDYLAEVRYEVIDQQLMRVVTPAGGSAIPQILAGDILDFQCQSAGGGRYDLVLSFEEASKQTDVHSIALRRIGQDPRLRP